MGWLRLSVRLTAFLLFLAATTALAAALRLADGITRRTVDRTPWARLCFQWGCRCLGLDIHQHGSPANTNVLFASNHISWSDIPVLGSLVPTRFLSKAEVGQWPLIGWLAREAGTLFITRGGGQARRIRKQISENLGSGESILVFPEGTTSAGLTVLPFHGLLLTAALQGNTPIQPVTISYRRAGRPDHLAPFIGDDDFHRHLVRMLRQPPARVDVVFHPAFTAPAETGAGDLGRQLHGIILDGLLRIHRGELDRDRKGLIRTADGPERPHLPSLHGGQQSPDQSTG